MSYENETANQLSNNNDDNMVFWPVLADGNDLNRLAIILEDAKDILAEHGNVNILLKPYTEGTDDSCTITVDYNDTYLSFSIEKAIQHIMTNINEDETMEGVTVISEPIETYGPFGKNYMIRLYLKKNDFTIN